MLKTFSLTALSFLALASSAVAQAPNWNGQYDEPPRGSYLQSCREITAFRGEVHARCKTRNGGWTWVSAYVRDCDRQGMANGDGKLICQSLANNGGGWNGGGGNNGGGWNGGGGGNNNGGGGGRPPANSYRGDLLMFEDAGYQGRVYEVIGDIPDLGAVKFNDKASSIKIVRGKWQICEHANYQGRCSNLDADQYVLPREWNDAISSVRKVR